jgi:voltage-gated potassium channel
MSTLRKKIYRIIFEADTRAGKLFDEFLLSLILFSIAVVMIESVSSIRQQYGLLLSIIEWLITAIFTIEYCLRIWVSDRPVKYIFSFYGIIDLLAILPTFLGILFPGAQSMLVIRGLRILRVFRILKLTRYSQAGRIILLAVWKSREKMIVFVLFIITIAIIMGAVMYLVEGEKSGFTDIPTSIYWAIVTLTTVGYGDLAPTTVVGQFIASIVMILGYAIIAVPTGIVTANLLSKNNTNTQVCSRCMHNEHDDDAQFCKKCGNSLA